MIKIVNEVSLADGSITVLHSDDVAPGAEFDVGTWTVSEAEIVGFGRQWDPLPFHVDAAAAAATPLAGLVASGIHTLAVMQRLSVDGLYSRCAIIAGRGIDSARFTKPVRAGTTLRGTVRIDAVRHRDARPSVVTTSSRLHDEDGDLVLVLVGESLWACRTAPTAS